MFKNSINGLDKVFRTDIDAPKVVLITGPPGSMKTSFCYSLMSSYLEKSKEFGLYVTLEESGDSHLRNMRSLGIKITPNLEISDFTDLRDGRDHRGRQLHRLHPFR
jgi:KaiC/GvpD/RAD55 family RecA-like ATPase